MILIEVILFSIIVRSLAIYIHKRWFNQGFFGDSSIHFMIIKQLKKDFQSKYIEQYLISPEPMSYPRVFHRFASIFRLDTIKKYPYVPNLLIFILATSFFTVYVHYFEIKYFYIYDYKLILYNLIFYFSLITNWYFDGPNIAYIKLSERLLGRVGASLFFLLSYIAIFYHDNYSFFLASFIGGLVLISSIFSRQVLIFISIIQAILLWNFQSLIILLLSFIIALFLSKDYFIRAMKHTLLQWRLYKTHTKKGESVKVSLSSFFELKEFKTRKLLGKIRYLIFKEPFRVFFFFPEIVLLIALDINVTNGLGTDTWLYIGSVFIVYIVTSTESYNHLGEAYRYPEYSLYFLIPFLLSLIFVNNNLPLINIFTIIYFTYIVVSMGLYILYIKLKVKLPQKDVLSDFLSKVNIQNDSVIYPISMRLGGDICARGEYKSFWWQPGIISTEIYDKYIEEYPYLKKNWDDIFNKHGVQYVMVDINALLSQKKLKLDWNYNFSNLILVYRDENYILYKVNMEKDK